eukprot:1736785-Amphidinium_carterae.2
MPMRDSISKSPKNYRTVQLKSSSWQDNDCWPIAARVPSAPQISAWDRQSEEDQVEGARHTQG